MRQIADRFTRHRPLEKRRGDPGDPEAGVMDAPRGVPRLIVRQRQRRDAVDHANLDGVEAFVD